MLSDYFIVALHSMLARNDGFYATVEICGSIQRLYRLYVLILGAVERNLFNVDGFSVYLLNLLICKCSRMRSESIYMKLQITLWCLLVSLVCFHCFCFLFLFVWFFLGFFVFCFYRNGVP
jgi:hypothetical protein